MTEHSLDTAALTDQVPPQSLEAEQATLGAMVLERDAIARAIELLRPEDFYRGSHGRLFQAMLALFERGDPVDLVTLGQRLKDTGELDDVGGMAYLMSLLDAAPTAANVERYARVVRQKAVLRGLIKAANEITARAHDSGRDVEQVVDECEHLIFEVGEQGITTPLTALRELVRGLFDKIEEHTHADTPATGLPTGFVELDGLISGMHPSELLVVAARPGMGKTALALKVASHVAVHEKRPVAIFSLDMSAEQVAERLLCAEARIDQQALRQRMLDESDYQRIVRAAERLYDAPIFVNDSASMRVLDIRARARRMAADQGSLGLVIVDYLQLVDGGGRFDNRTQEIGYVSRSLKSLARELRTPVIACAQLSRAVETRGQVRRPLLSDLRESGSIEAEADVVMFIYRPMYYGEEELQRAEYTLDQSGIAEIIIAKQRNGPTGKVSLCWVDRCATFEELAAYEEE